MPKGDTLSVKQQLFVNAYLIHSNATDAAQIAGYKWNRITLNNIGAENMAKPIIMRAIHTAELATAERHAINEDWITMKAIKNYERAFELDQIPAANVALRLIADVNGIIIQRSESKHLEVTASLVDIAALNPGEKADMLRKAADIVERLALPEGDSEAT